VGYHSEYTGFEAGQQSHLGCLDLRRMSVSGLAKLSAKACPPSRDCDVHPPCEGSLKIEEGVIAGEVTHLGSYCAKRATEQ
jgi:hypothetical protein